MEISEVSEENGYHMGVFLCLGQQIHNVSCENAKKLTDYKNLNDIHDELQETGIIFILLGSGIHKIKKKAEQEACKEAILYLN